MGVAYDEKRPMIYITYLDANNLYGWAMCQPLRARGFTWMTDFDLVNWRETSRILEVDLEYPKELHDDHNYYSLAPRRLTINRVEKLIQTLNEKIHRGMSFEEEPWLKYIELNTKLRANAKNDFKKDFFLLINNSLSRKTMENIRYRVEKALKLAAKPNFKHCTIFDENFVAIQMKRTKLVFEKPVYCGMNILDISKRYVTSTKTISRRCMEIVPSLSSQTLRA